MLRRELPPTTYNGKLSHHHHHHSVWWSWAMDKLVAMPPNFYYIAVYKLPLVRSQEAQIWGQHWRPKRSHKLCSRPPPTSHWRIRNLNFPIARTNSCTSRLKLYSGSTIARSNSRKSPQTWTLRSKEPQSLGAQSEIPGCLQRRDR